MKRNLFKLIIAFMLACMMLACADFGSHPVPDDPTPSSIAVDSTAEPAAEPQYRSEAAPAQILRETPLTELTAYEADWPDVPVYACMDKDGVVHYYVFAHEETKGEMGFLSVSFEEDTSGEIPVPVLVIDYDGGFVGFPELAVCETAAPSEYLGVAKATIPGIDDTDPENPIIRSYYPSLGDGLQPGAIPVEVREQDDGTYVVLHPAINQAWLYVCGTERVTPEETEVPEDVTPEPEETEPATAAPATGKTGTTGKQTPKPTAKPTAAPSEGFVWKCIYCGASFGSDYDAWYHHAYENPGCYNVGHVATPTPKPTPTPEPGGHWEEVWVVDVPKVCHTVWHCNVCGWETTDGNENTQHQVAHVNAGEGSGYHTYVVVDQEEEGHWEKVWVPDP